MNSIINKDKAYIEDLNNKIHKALQGSNLKYNSTAYSPIYKHNQEDKYCMLICSCVHKRKIINNCLTDGEKKLLQDTNLTEWTEL